MALGVVIVWGISLSTFVTLFAIPALYIFLAPFTKPVGAVERALAELESTSKVVVKDEAAALARRQPAE